MTAAENRMSQAAFGRKHGLSRQRVGQLVKDGRVLLDEDRLVIVDQSEVNLATMVDQRKANRERQVAMAAAGNVLVYKGTSVGPSECTPFVEGLEPSGGQIEPMAPLFNAEPAAERQDAIKGDEKPKAAANEAANYWEQKARREKIEADRAELAYRKSIGELVDAREVERSRHETALKVATAMLQIPARIAPVVAPNDPHRAEQLMTEEIKKAIHELAGDLDRPVAGDDAERPEARAA